MYTSAALLDIHKRTHTSLRKLLAHCAGFEANELARSLEGFGYDHLLEQLHHVIGAERYWMGVLEGKVLTDDHPEERASIAALETLRAQVEASTAAWLAGASADELNLERELTTWGDKQVRLVPAHVVLRTQTHAFQHQGQVAAMARLLGRPIPSGLDFPLTPLD